MSQEQTFCDYSDSDEDFVQPSPSAARRSTRIQCRDSPWALWSPDNISKTLEAAGIPFNHDLSREDLILLAQNTLGNPPTPTVQIPATSTAPILFRRKRTAKSSPTPSAKRSTSLARAPSPLNTSVSADPNSLLIQAVQSLTQTVKGLESKMANMEKKLANPLISLRPVTDASAIPPSGSSNVRSDDPSSGPSTSNQQAFSYTAHTPYLDAPAPVATSAFNLSTAAPAQSFGRRFVSPAAATVSPNIRANIVQGKDIHLASLLLPLQAVDRKMVDCGDVAGFLKTSDPRLQCNLAFFEFVIAFSIFRDILCQSFPERREELDLYLAMMADFNQRYGGTLFY